MRLGRGEGTVEDPANREGPLRPENRGGDSVRLTQGHSGELTAGGGVGRSTIQLPSYSPPSPVPRPQIFTEPGDTQKDTAVRSEGSHAPRRTSVPLVDSWP